ELRHPLRLFLHPRDLAHDLGVQAALGLEDVVLRDEETVLLFVIGPDVDFGNSGHQATSSAFNTAASSASAHSEYPVPSSRSATSGPPESTNFPSTSTCT